MFSLLAILAGLAAWGIACLGSPPGLSLVYLWGSVAAVGAAYHHGHREAFEDDDIGHYASPEPRPVRLRGVLETEPTIAWQTRTDPLRTIPRTDKTKMVVCVSHLRQHDDWVPVSGRAQVSVAEHVQGMHVGDEVEIVGRLSAPQGPVNPGGFDYASYLRDQRICAHVQVSKTSAGVVRLAEKWPGSLGGWLAVIRGWGQRVLQEALPKEQSGVAMALLLGEGSTMTDADWEKYKRTGVIHVLAISGQHLVVLAAFLWLALRVLHVRRRQGALFVALFLLAYSLLAGGRPPVMRSAVTVCACCGGVLLRRPVLPANSFALAWIVVAALNPTDLFTAGCQLSFLSVAVLYWGTSRWFRAEGEDDPLDRLLEESRSRTEKCLRWLGRQILVGYAVTLVIWLGLLPLLGAHYQMMPFIGVLIGPPVVLLTSVALLAGFMLLLLAPLGWPLTWPFAWVTSWSLAGCEWIVDHTDGRWFTCWYVGVIPTWCCGSPTQPFWPHSCSNRCVGGGAGWDWRGWPGCASACSAARPAPAPRSCAAPSWQWGTAAARSWKPPTAAPCCTTPAP
jgi:competence protein ComEC